MVNIFLCDDTPLQLYCTRDLITDYTQGRDAQVFCFGSSAEFLAGLAVASPDIAVLDISLGSDNGIELAKAINARFPACQIIFLTAYAEYTSDAYFAKHTWFILKKDTAKYLPAALDKAFRALELGTHEVPAIWVKKRRNLEKIPTAEVLYLERIGHTTKVVRLHDTLVCRQSPEELLSPLEENAFIRCHQSFWVNRDKIFSFVGDRFHLIDGSEILISRSYKKEAARIFEETLRRRAH